MIFPALEGLSVLSEEEESTITGGAATASGVATASGSSARTFVAVKVSDGGRTRSAVSARRGDDFSESAAFVSLP